MARVHEFHLRTEKVVHCIGPDVKKLLTDISTYSTIGTDNTMVDAYLRIGGVSRALFVPYYGES